MPYLKPIADGAIDAKVRCVLLSCALFSHTCRSRPYRARCLAAVALHQQTNAACGPSTRPHTINSPLSTGVIRCGETCHTRACQMCTISAGSCINSELFSVCCCCFQLKNASPHFVRCSNSVRNEGVYVQNVCSTTITFERSTTASQITQSITKFIEQRQKSSAFALARCFRRVLLLVFVFFLCFFFFCCFRLVVV